VRASEGIVKVWVNGVLGYTAQDGATGARAGRFLRRG
jgi:N-acyl-D-amino-acid deacylase